MAEDAEGSAPADDDDPTGTDDARPSDPSDQPIVVVDHDRWRPEARLAVKVGAVAVAILAGIAGWTAFGAWRCHHDKRQQELFLGVARQSAHDMTTISHTHVEADVQRILDLSVGQFHDEFAQRRKRFIDNIQQEQSTSQGTVAEAGLESIGDNSARALVTVSVKLTKADSGEQKLDGFRLRIGMERVGAAVKVSEVEYVQ